MTDTTPIDVEIWLQDPSNTAFRLNRSTLDVGRLLPAGPDMLHLDSGRLGTGTLGTPPPPHIWWPITPHLTGAEAFSGLRADEAMLTPEPGQLTAIVKNLPELPQMGATAGVPIRVTAATPDMQHTGDLAPLWWGWIDNVTTAWDPRTGGSHSTITAGDWVSRAAKVNRYGAQVAEDEWDRVCRLVSESLPGADRVTPWRGWDGVGTWWAGPILDEAPLLEHLAMAAQPDYMIAAHPTLEGNRLVMLYRGWFDDAVTYAVLDDLPNSWRGSYLDVTQTSGSEQITTRVDITNHSILTEDGQDRVQTVTTTAVDATSEDTWGTRSKTLDIAAAADMIGEAGRRILAHTHYTDAEVTVSSVTMRGADWLLPGDWLNWWWASPDDPADRLEWWGIPVLSNLDVILRGRTHHLVVSSVTHTITPTDWRVSLGTMRRKNTAI